MKTIHSAFVKAQQGFAPAIKNSTNPHFKSKYADLGACIEAVIDSLNANGIGLMQKTHPCDSGVMVETIFVHESGETLSAGQLHVPASKMDAQGYGSALSYARRYSLMAACGIAPEEDDGNAATKSPPLRHKPTDGPKLTDKRLSVVTDTANDAKERFAADDLLGAYELCQSITDVEEKTTLWQQLPSNLRSAIKKHAESLKEQA